MARASGGERQAEIELDLDHVPEDAATQILLAAGKAGYKVKVVGGKGGGKGKWGGGGRAGTPPRTGAPGVSRPPRCANCGGEHGTCECTKPVFAEDQQECCGLHRQPDARGLVGSSDARGCGS